MKSSGYGQLQMQAASAAKAAAAAAAAAAAEAGGEDPAQQESDQQGQQPVARQLVSEFSGTPHHSAGPALNSAHGEALRDASSAPLLPLLCEPWVRSVDGLAVCTQGLYAACLRRRGSIEAVMRVLVSLLKTSFLSSLCPTPVCCLVFCIPRMPTCPFASVSLSCLPLSLTCALCAASTGTPGRARSPPRSRGYPNFPLPTSTALAPAAPLPLPVPPPAVPHPRLPTELADWLADAEEWTATCLTGIDVREASQSCLFVRMDGGWGLAR